MRLTVFIWLLSSACVVAQTGDFQSTQLPFGARNAALGGKVVSLADGDVMQVYHNPALLDSVVSQSLGLDFSPKFAGILGFAGSYAANIKGAGKWGFSMTYLDYGDIEQRAANGDQEGTFTANDFVLMASKYHRISSFSLGLNLKFARQAIAGYGSSMLAVDLGGLYRHPTADFSVGMVIKNAGFVLREYTTSNAEVPFDVQISTSIKPQYMPFRFSISAYNLTDEERYFLADADNTQPKSTEIADRVFRKLNVGAELILHRNFQLQMGYSHLRRQELKVEDIGYGSGLSFGLKIGIKQFELRYAFANYHAAGGTNFITIQTNLDRLKRI